MKTSDTRTALITGATEGIGRAYAEFFASHHYSLILVGKDFQKSAHLASELRDKFDADSQIITCDLGQVSALNMLLLEIDNQKIDVLVNNVVEEFVSSKNQLSSSDRKRIVEIQVNSTVTLSLHMLRFMIAENKGYIINVAGSPSKIFNPQSSFCQSSCRMFIRQFTEGLLSNLSGTGVYVQAVCPGYYKDDSKKHEPIDSKYSRNINSAEDIVNKAMEDFEQGIFLSYPGSNNFFIGKNRHVSSNVNQSSVKIS